MAPGTRRRVSIAVLWGPVLPSMDFTVRLALFPCLRLRFARGEPQLVAAGAQCLPVSINACLVNCLLFSLSWFLSSFVRSGARKRAHERVRLLFCWDGMNWLNPCCVAGSDFSRALLRK